MKKIFNKQNFLALSLLVLVSLFSFSLFKNIQFPLLWGDEAETAIYAERIIKYGFPKVHDNNNSIYFVVIKDNTGINEKYDLYTGNTWGQYYFAALGQYFAGQTNDIYQKTKYLRVPFAIAGIIGVLILPLSVLFLFRKNRNKKLLFIVGYLFLVLFLVSLVLHLREVRSYSLAVLFSSLTLFIFSKTFFDKTLPKWIYVFLMTLILLLLSNSFPPAYLALVVSLSSYIIIDFYFAEMYKKNLEEVDFVKSFSKKTFFLLLPFLISVVVMIPISKFFKMSETSSKAYYDVAYNFQLYRYYLTHVINFLTLNNYLILGIFQKVVTVFLFYFYRKKMKVKKMDTSRLNETLKVSVYFTYIFIIHVLLVPLTPFLFDRYFVFLQPLLVLIIVLDIFLNLEIVFYLIPSEKRNNLLMIYCYLVFFFFMVSMVLKLDTITGHIYELRNRYFGPVDAIVSYIKSNYKNTEDLVIDTNLEQTSFIYYLKSQVICDEITKCKKTSPDIIIIRRYMMSSKDFIDKTQKTLATGHYRKILLSILDYPTNNIPEFTLSLRHLFKTPITNNNDEKVMLLIKK